MPRPPALACRHSPSSRNSQSSIDVCWRIGLVCRAYSGARRGGKVARVAFAATAAFEWAVKRMSRVRTRRTFFVVILGIALAVSLGRSFLVAGQAGGSAGVWNARHG